MRRRTVVIFLLAVSVLSIARCPFYTKNTFTGAGIDSMEVSSISGDSLAVATFAGGCFWCMQGPFDALDGVVSTRVGLGENTQQPLSWGIVSSR